MNTALMQNFEVNVTILHGQNLYLSEFFPKRRHNHHHYHKCIYNCGGRGGVRNSWLD
jgi:hypothetical protein